MSGVRFDYTNERGRHEPFVGREALLAHLDELLIERGGDRWVVVTGGPGMGKSAILVAWLKRRQAAGAAVPHHFIRRGEYDWDDPAQLVDALVAQIDESFPAAREPVPGAHRHPAARLASALSRVSGRVLGPSGGRLVVLIDGLDEYDPPAGHSADPLASFLPHALPRGVSVLCASRPRHPYVSSLSARGELVQIDLDDAGSAADNDATVRRLWEDAAEPLGLDRRFVDEAVARAGGNVQHAVQLRRQLAATPAHRRRVDDIPRGLEALLERTWERIAHGVVLDGLGILCAAREALTLDELGAAACWRGESPRREFLRGAAEVLVEAQRPDGQREYRLHHDSIRTHLMRKIGRPALSSHHGALARELATWPLPARPIALRYALRHALSHRAEAGDWRDVARIAGDTGFLAARLRELGAQDVESDVARMAERCRADRTIDPTIGRTIGRRLADLARALARESHWLQESADATAAVLWNRLRRSGWSERELDSWLDVPADLPFLRVRYAATRESSALLRDLVGRAGRGARCAVTPNGRRVISADDCRLMVSDLEDGRALVTLEGHTQRVTACTVTPDGTRAVSASEDQTLKLWDLERGREIATLAGHASAVTACAVTPDGTRVVSASYDQTLRVWDLESGRPLATLEGHVHWVRDCAVTPDGTRVVSASRDATLRVWDLASARELAILEGHAGAVTACAVTPDGSRVVSASEDRTLKIWDLADARELATLEGHTGAVTACAVTPDGRRVVSAANDQTLKVWNLDSTHGLATPEGHAAEVNACAAAPDGERVVSASEDRTLKVWDLETGRAITTLEGHTEPVSACAVTPDGRRVVSASWDQTLKVWDLETGRAITTLEGQRARVTACALTADGGRVISASDHGSLTVWDLETGRALATMAGHRDRVTACVVTPDGRRMISASSDGTMKVWDLESGRALASLIGHSLGVLACALTPDGRRVVSASWDTTLKVWDLESRRAIATLEGHADWVMACTVTRDGQRVISASRDRTLKVWDLATWRCLLTHRGDVAYRAVAASASGIVAGDTTGGVSFLDWPPSDRGQQAGLDVRDDPPHQPRPAPITASTPIVDQHTILFLAANPAGTRERAFDQEARAILAEIERSRHRDRFNLETRWAPHPDDLLRDLRKLRPTVLHFSGHGSPSHVGASGATPAPGRDGSAGAAPDSGAQLGLLFQAPDGGAQVVSLDAIKATIQAAGSSLKLVILNAGYSDKHAEALRAHVDCVIGMKGLIDHGAALHFAMAFYGGLGEGESIAAAFEQGCALIHLSGLRDHDMPALRVRAGVDARELVLVPR